MSVEAEETSPKPMSIRERTRARREATRTRKMVELRALAARTGYVISAVATFTLEEINDWISRLQLESSRQETEAAAAAAAEAKRAANQRRRGIEM